MAFSLDFIRPGEGRLVRLGRVDDIDYGVAAQTQFFCRLAADVVQARLAAHRTGYIEGSHIQKSDMRDTGATSSGVRSPAR